MLSWYLFACKKPCHFLSFKVAIGLGFLFLLRADDVANVAAVLHGQGRLGQGRLPLGCGRQLPLSLGLDEVEDVLTEVLDETRQLRLDGVQVPSCVGNTLQT